MTSPEQSGKGTLGAGSGFSFKNLGPNMSADRPAVAGAGPEGAEEYAPQFLTSTVYQAKSASSKSLGATSEKSDGRPSSAKEQFQAAGKDVMMRNMVSSSFHTLRDMCGEGVYCEFKDMKKVAALGEGAFAVVELMDYHGAKLAVKKLKPSLAPSDLHDFVQESQLLKKLKNINIVEFKGLGQYGEQDSEMFIAQECMMGGSLKSLLYQQGIQPSKVLYRRQDVLRWAIQMAKGLKYLHEAKPMVIHRDLKLENILLDTKNYGEANAKIADFGLHKVVQQIMRHKDESEGELKRAATRQRHESEDAGQPGGSNNPAYKMTGETGSLMYMAPEVLIGEQYNEKVDVFSFGVMLFEMMDYTMMVGKVSRTGEPTELQAYATRVSEGYRPPIPAHWPLSLKSVVERCWEQDWKTRPSFGDVIPMLEAIKDDVIAMDAKMDSNNGCCTIL